MHEHWIEQPERANGRHVDGTACHCRWWIVNSCDCPIGADHGRED